MFIADWYRSVKWFIQRGNRGWANCDVWQMDTYLAKTIRDMLKHLRANLNGFPCGLTDAEWEAILDKLIKTFDTAHKIMDRNWFYIPTDEWTQERYDDMVKHAKTSVWMFRNMDHRVMTLDECIEFEEGFDLFKKYFFNLWD